MAIPAIVSATRRKNFRRLVIEKWGGHRALVAQALEFKEPNLVTRYMSEGKSAKPIGHALARKIEAVIGEQEGWMDVSHDETHTTPAKRGTLEERIKALPAALREYILMEIEICEQVQHATPTDFMRAPTRANRRTFQDYLQGVMAQLGGKRSVA